MESAKNKRADKNMCRVKGRNLRIYLNENLLISELDPRLIAGKYQNLVNLWKENPGPNGGY